jgi:hypothetical protein
VIVALVQGGLRRYQIWAAGVASAALMPMVVARCRPDSGRATWAPVVPGDGRDLATVRVGDGLPTIYPAPILSPVIPDLDWRYGPRQVDRDARVGVASSSGPSSRCLTRTAVTSVRAAASPAECQSPSAAMSSGGSPADKPAERSAGACYVEVMRSVRLQRVDQIEVFPA